MSVPIRRPDFAAIYPTEESFREAIAHFDSVADQTATAPAPAPDFVHWAPEDSGHGLPPRLSLRQASAFFVRMAGGRIVSEHEGLVDTLLPSVARFSDAASPARRVDRRHLRHYRLS
jgi:hypothetical protein